MSDKKFATTVIQLPFTTAKAMIHQCEMGFLLPRQVVARSFGEPEPLGEPVIFTIPGQDDKWSLPD